MATRGDQRDLRRGRVSFQLLAGKYLLCQPLGAGGMGIVRAAIHVGLRQVFAVKLLPPHLAAQAVPMERLLQEARATAQLKSEHAVRVVDVGLAEDGSPYFVMEHLEGSDLRALMRREGPLGVARACELVACACDAIAEAHGLGILHRDLKPSNLFLASRADGSPLLKVLDFGVAKLTGPGVRRGGLTRPGEAVGSPFYASPEQLRGAPDVDERTDVWSLGAVLHELLTGSRPFVARTLGEHLHAIVDDGPVPLRQVLPDVPAELEEIVTACLDKDRGSRLPSARALGGMLRQIVAVLVRQACITLEPSPSPSNDVGRTLRMGSMWSDRPARLTG